MGILSPPLALFIVMLSFYLFIKKFFLNLILFFNFTILYWFCHILKWIHHRYSCIPVADSVYFLACCFIFMFEIEHLLMLWQFIYFILFFNFTILYWFCHISTWIRHRYTRVPHPEPSSLLRPRTIPTLYMRQQKRQFIFLIF